MPFAFTRIVPCAFGFPLVLAISACSQPSQSPPLAVTISQATTGITSPLRSDGYPDYPAALNLRYASGVTPENNAVVLFWQAMGPGEVPQWIRTPYFQTLQMPAPPQQGDYFVEHPKQETFTATCDRMRRLTSRLWSAQEFPESARWLAANERPLALFLKASNRPQWYDPRICAGTTSLITVPLPAPYRARFVAEALAARAMLRIEEGHVTEGWDDLLACHRLARLVGQGPSVVEASYAQSVEHTACVGDLAWLQNADWTVEQLASASDDLRKLSPLLDTGEKFNFGERYAYLEVVVSCARKGPAALTELTAALDQMVSPDVPSEIAEESKELKALLEPLIRYSANTPIDWDLILRLGNDRFDRIAAAWRMPASAERWETLRRLDAEFNALREAAKDTASLEQAMKTNRRQALSERIGNVLWKEFTKDLWGTVLNTERSRMQFEVGRLAFALASWRADHGAYPSALADLVPQYVSEIPRDVFNEQDGRLHYRPEGDGFVLYGVGNNGRDDGGRSYEDRQHDEDWDDVTASLKAK